MVLTDSQIVALRWMRDFPSTFAGWRRNGRAAYGPPEKWDAMRLSGASGSINIAASDWDAIRNLIKSTPEDGKIYRPTEAALNLIK